MKTKEETISKGFDTKYCDLRLPVSNANGSMKVTITKSFCKQHNIDENCELGLIIHCIYKKGKYIDLCEVYRKPN